MCLGTETIKLIPDLATVLSPESQGSGKSREALPGTQVASQAKPQPARLKGAVGQVGTSSFSGTAGPG